MANQMLVTRSSRLPKQGNLPILSITPTELEISRLNPTAWVEAKSGVRTSGALVESVVDRTGSRVWAPVNPSFKPSLLKTGKGIPYFQFGKIGVNNGGVLGTTVPSFPANGVYNLAVLAFCPDRNTGGWVGTGGNVIGNKGNLADNNALRMRLGPDTYDGNVIWLNHGGGAVTGTDNYPINTSYAFRGAWHLHYITVTPTLHRWELDGAVLQQTSYPAKPFDAGDAQQMLIGGSGGSTLNHGLQGFIASVIMVPGEVTNTGKAAIVRHLQALKAALEQV